MPSPLLMNEASEVLELHEDVFRELFVAAHDCLDVPEPLREALRHLFVDLANLCGRDAVPDQFDAWWFEVLAAHDEAEVNL